MRSGPPAHPDALCAFLRSTKLDTALKRWDWASFARAYNGSGQVSLYAAKLAAAYACFSIQMAT